MQWTRVDCPWVSLETLKDNNPFQAKNCATVYWPGHHWLGKPLLIQRQHDYTYKYVFIVSQHSSMNGKHIDQLIFSNQKYIRGVVSIMFSSLHLTMGHWFTISQHGQIQNEAPREKIIIILYSFVKMHFMMHQSDYIAWRWYSTTKPNSQQGSEGE